MALYLHIGVIGVICLHLRMAGTPQEESKKYTNGSNVQRGRSGARLKVSLLLLKTKK